MEINDYAKKHETRKGYILALLFIVAGLLFLGKNLGWIEPSVINLIFSWPMILILIGAVSIFRRHLIGGGIAIGIGIYFFLPRLNWGIAGWFHTYWPLGLILLGLIILLKRRDNNYVKGHTTGRHRFFSRHSFASSEGGIQEGYVRSDVSFASVKHIVLDPVFRGADIDISFGGVVLDLRRTTLEAKETVVHIDCSFGGVELYVPDHWEILVETDSLLGECYDRRNHTQPIDTEHRLIVCGDLSFGGIEIKS